MMIELIDGPANGVSLDLMRAPIMLRVVRDRAGNWDALDQLADEPKRGETIFLYRMVGNPLMSGHIDYRDKAGRRRGTAPRRV